ncbi:hypothetical protein BJX96DRAFT_178818 [Aspergillus floccosus]
MKKQRKRNTSWAARARRWNRKFGTNRSVNSLRGLWNRLYWGWKPKWEIRGVEDPIGEIEKPLELGHPSTSNASQEAPSAVLEDRRLPPARAILAVRPRVRRPAARDLVPRREDARSRFAKYILFCALDIASNNQLSSPTSRSSSRSLPATPTPQSLYRGRIALPQGPQGPGDSLRQEVAAR